MTRVAFRWIPEREDGELTAILPDVPATLFGNRLLTGYAHVGQHCHVHPDWLGAEPATPDEYAPLLAELESIGYDDLEVIA